MQYDVIENNGVLAPSRREAIIDPMIGANHNDNKPAHGKTFDASKTGADQKRGLISTIAAHYSLGKALHSIKISRHTGKPFDANKKGPDQMRGLISTLAVH